MHMIYMYIHPCRLTWNIIMEVWKMIFLSKWVIYRFHVNLPGGSVHHCHVFFKKLSKGFFVTRLCWSTRSQGLSSNPPLLWQSCLIPMRWPRICHVVAFIGGVSFYCCALFSCVVCCCLFVLLFFLFFVFYFINPPYPKQPIRFFLPLSGPFQIWISTSMIWVVTSPG